MLGIEAKIALGVVVGAMVALYGGFLLRAFLRARSRRTLAFEQKLKPRQWRKLLKDAECLRNVPDEVRDRICEIVPVLKDEKRFEACGGLKKVTERMKNLVCAQAALLLAGREQRFFPKLRSILIYPDGYQARDEHGDHQHRLGESWGSGSIVLAWTSVLKGGQNPEDGHNVVLHEFAHQLDQENGPAEGLPVLAETMSHSEWAKAFQASYEDFCTLVEKQKPSPLDSYGATNPAEFFAVATETFFEKPKQLQETYPNLYTQLRHYYGLDPSGWTG